VDEDTLMGIALEAGADDLKRSGPTFEITCDPTAFNAVQDALKANNLTPTAADVSQVADTAVDVDLEDGKKVLRLLEAIDDHDDVQNVYSNVHLSDQLVAELADG